MSKVMTRIVFAVASVIVSAMLVATGAVKAQEKIRVGIIGQFSGPFASAGKEYREGIDTFTALNGMKVGGREVELVYRDVGGTDPGVAKRLAEELVVQEKVSIIGGFFLSPESFAAASVLTQTKTPGIVFNGATPSIVKQSDYFVRVGDTMTQVSSPQAEFALNHGKKRFYIAVLDYSPGVATEEAVKETLKAAGATIVGTDRIPLNTIDFAPYAERIANAKPDAVVIFFGSGRPAVSGLKTLAAQGILGNKDIMVIGQAETDDFELGNYDDFGARLLFFARLRDRPAERGERQVQEEIR